MISEAKIRSQLARLEHELKRLNRLNPQTDINLAEIINVRAQMIALCWVLEEKP